MLLTTGTGFQFSLFPVSHTLLSLMELGKETPVLSQGGHKATRGRHLRVSSSLRAVGLYLVTKEIVSYSVTDTNTDVKPHLPLSSGPWRNGSTALPQQLETLGSFVRGTWLAAGHWSLLPARGGLCRRAHK